MNLIAIQYNKRSLDVARFLASNMENVGVISIRHKLDSIVSARTLIRPEVFCGDEFVNPHWVYGFDQLDTMVTCYDDNPLGQRMTLGEYRYRVEECFLSKMRFFFLNWALSERKDRTWIVIDMDNSSDYRYMIGSKATMIGFKDDFDYHYRLKEDKSDKQLKVDCKKIVGELDFSAAR